VAWSEVTGPRVTQAVSVGLWVAWWETDQRVSRRVSRSRGYESARGKRTFSNTTWQDMLTSE
jgi:hypothetical protein